MWPRAVGLLVVFAVVSASCLLVWQPNCHVVRHVDMDSQWGIWKAALTHPQGNTGLALTP